MKKILVLTVALFLSLQSCVTTEELTVTNSGKNDLVLDINFTDMLDMIPNKEKMFNENLKMLNVINGEELTVEQFLDIALIKEKNAEQKKDSILKANPKLLKETEHLRFKIDLTEVKGNFQFIIRTKNLTELNKSLASLKDINEIIAQSTKDENIMSSENQAPNFFTSSKFEQTKKTFKRKVEANSTINNKNFSEMMAAMFSYKIKVHFDQPILSVSYPDAIISTDRKSFEKTFAFTKVIEDPKILEYTVEF